MEGGAALRSWIDVPAENPFPIQNLPYGVFYRNSDRSKKPTIGVAIGDQVLDLARISEASLFNGSELKESSCFLQVLFFFIFFNLSCVCQQSYL